MKFLSIYVLLVTCLFAKGYANTIQCYQCEDCKDLDDSLLHSCPAEVTTVAPPADSTVISPTDSTVTSLTDSTEASPTDSTAALPTDSTLSPPTDSTAAPETDTTLAPPKNSILATPTDSIVQPSTDLDVPAGPGPVQGGSVSADGQIQKFLQNKQLVDYMLQGSPKIRNYRSVMRAGPTYHCYSFDKVDGDNRKVQKGCVQVTEGKKPCDVLIDKLGESTDNCTSCQHDKCNSSAALRYSALTVIMAVVISLFYKQN